MTSPTGPAPQSARSWLLEVTKVGSRMVWPWAIALVVLSSSLSVVLRDIYANRTATAFAYQGLAGKMDVALSRQAEVLARLREIEAQQVKMRYALDRLAEKCKESKP